VAEGVALQSSHTHTKPGTGSDKGAVHPEKIVPSDEGTGYREGNQLIDGDACGTWVSATRIGRYAHGAMAAAASRHSAGRQQQMASWCHWGRSQDLTIQGSAGFDHVRSRC
jgi:hypothetical protein